MALFKKKKSHKMALEINTEIFTHAFSNASGVGGKTTLGTDSASNRVLRNM